MSTKVLEPEKVNGEAVDVRFTEAPAPEEIYNVTGIGEGWELLSEKKVYFTKELAYRLGEMKTIEGERKFREKHCQILMKCMMRGTFHPEFVQLVTCDLGDDTYRLNGQHCAWAIISFDKLPPAASKYQVKLFHYRAETMEDMRQLYASIDRGAPRTPANVVSAYLLGSDEFAGYNQSAIKRLVEGMRFWLLGAFAQSRQKIMDADDLAVSMMTDHQEICLKTASILEDVHKNKHLARASVYAAILSSVQKQQAASVEFWDRVKDGAGLQVGDPRLKLRTELLSSAVKNAGGGNSSKKQVDPEVIYRWCALAWRAWRKGEMLTAFRVGSLENKRPAFC